MVMIRCLQCDATLMNTETVCIGCGAAVPQKNPRPGIAQRLRAIVKVLLITTAVMTVLSMFTDIGPSFKKCIMALLVLFLVKSSTDQMVESSDSSS